MQSQLPIKYAYKVTDTFYAGEYPFEEEPKDGLPKLQKLLDFGIVHFINLTSERLTEYENFLPKHCTYTNLSTVDYTVPSFENLKKAHDIISQSKEKVYIHCKGGHDRTGVAVATYFIYMGLTVEEAKEQYLKVSKPVKGRYPHTPLMETKWKVLKEYQEWLAHHKTETHEDHDYLKLPNDVSILPFRLAGILRIDIIPYKLTVSNAYAKAGELWHEKTFFIHRNIGVEKATVVCPKSIDPENKCPICEYIRANPSPIFIKAHRNSILANQNDADAIKNIFPQERQLFNVIKAGEPDKIYILNQEYEILGQRIDERIKNEDPDEHFEFYADPDTWTKEDAAKYGENIVVGSPKGMTVKLVLQKKSAEDHSEYFDVSYMDFKARKYTTRNLIDKAVDLDKVLIVHSYKKLQKLFGNGTDTEE
jgi:protein-tyrosine phosphatase